MRDLTLLLGGLAGLAITGILFAACLPRNGKVSRIVGTELEAYAGAAFASGFAVSFTMLLNAAFDLIR